MTDVLFYFVLYIASDFFDPGTDLQYSTHALYHASLVVESSMLVLTKPVYSFVFVCLESGFCLECVAASWFEVDASPAFESGMVFSCQLFPGCGVVVVESEKRHNNTTQGYDPVRVASAMSLEADGASPSGARWMV